MLIRTFGNKIVELCREDFLTDELYYKEIMYVKGLLKKENTNSYTTNKKDTNEPVLEEIMEYLME
jgi:hypothetical protein